MNNLKPRYFLVWHNDETGSVLYCKDGLFRRSVNFGTPNWCLKLWNKKGFAIRAAKKHGAKDCTIKYVYPNQKIDHLGNVTGDIL